MKKSLIILVLFLIIHSAYSQSGTLYQTGLTAEQNLNAIGNLARYSTGGIGFDTRYEGIKGSPRLFDTLLTSFLQLKGEDYYIQLESNLDLMGNSLIFINPKTGKLLSIPSGIIKEVKINYKGKEMIFRTTSGRRFENDIREEKFFQVLKDGHNQFIKLPLKKIIEADFKNVYGADRRYDEYSTYYKYFIMSSDSSFHRIQLNKKSLIKMFPDKKELITRTVEAKSFENDEEMVIDILDKIRN
jgi:hypothetical protein